MHVDLSILQIPLILGRGCHKWHVSLIFSTFARGDVPVATSISMAMPMKWVISS
jgi:hypothetical protein